LTFLRPFKYFSLKKFPKFFFNTRYFSLSNNSLNPDLAQKKKMWCGRWSDAWEGGQRAG